tara:strand:- start:1702 stop:2160 length:459 start_codon:yes stop_codon:yes gene_type:complete
MTKLNILLIRKLNIFVDFSKRFVIIINNFDKELIDRRDELRKISIDNDNNREKERISLTYSVKEDLFVILQKLIQLYIDNEIKPIINKIPNNTFFNQQIRFLEEANNKLISTRFTVDFIKKNINKFAKELNINLEYRTYKTVTKKINKKIRL